MRERRLTPQEHRPQRVLRRRISSSVLLHAHCAKTVDSSHSIAALRTDAQARSRRSASPVVDYGQRRIWTFRHTSPAHMLMRRDDWLVLRAAMLAPMMNLNRRAIAGAQFRLIGPLTRHSPSRDDSQRDLHVDDRRVVDRLNWSNPKLRSDNLTHADSMKAHRVRSVRRSRREHASERVVALVSWVNFEDVPAGPMEPGDDDELVARRDSGKRPCVGRVHFKPRVGRPFAPLSWSVVKGTKGRSNAADWMDRVAFSHPVTEVGGFLDGAPMKRRESRRPTAARQCATTRDRPR